MAEPIAVPPVEAIDHFRAKGYTFGFSWMDVAAAEHLAAFTVAKAMRLDILEDVRGAVDAAIAEGLSFRQFQQRLEPTLRRKGWWGRQEMVDPLTGERRLVQLGSPRRLRIIFDTNLRMSGARGRWERFERLRDAMPFLRYVAVRDARTRPEHMAWHGTVLHVDHPFWETHAPPNGWNCRCTLVQLSVDDLDRYGYEVSRDPVLQTGSWTNRRTGATVQVPRGIDPGFQHNVGTIDRARAALDVAEAKHGTGSIVPAPPANPTTWAEYALVGREAVREIAGEAGPPEAAGFSRAFRAGLLARMRHRVGGVAPDVASKTGGRVSREAAERVRSAVEALVPASWVGAGNAVRAVVQGRSGYAGGSYHYARQPPELHVDADPATSVHEYIHHLQYRVAGFHAAWREFYRDRTRLPDGSRERAVASKYGSRYLVRKDRWIDDYMGHVSEHELAARVFEILAHGMYRREFIGVLAAKDPELLNFAVGFLLRFDP